MTSVQSSAGSLHIASWREQLSCVFLSLVRWMNWMNCISSLCFTRSRSKLLEHEMEQRIFFFP